MKQAMLLWMLPFLMAPDGAGGSGAPPGEPSLEDWITRLNEAEKKNRKTIVEELAKTLGIKIGAAYQKLKEAGWDPKTADTQPGPSATAGDSATGGNPSPVPPAVPPPRPAPPTETFPVLLRHKTPYPHYRRAGLLLTQQFKPYAVTKEQLIILGKDPWVEGENIKK
jgi:hypothetical protein